MGQTFTFRQPNECRVLSAKADQPLTSQACQDLTLTAAGISSRCPRVGGLCQRADWTTRIPLQARPDHRSRCTPQGISGSPLPQALMEPMRQLHTVCAKCAQIDLFLRKLHKPRDFRCSSSPLMRNSRNKGWKHATTSDQEIYRESPWGHDGRAAPARRADYDVLS
jgi:hypothetical protein